MGLDSVELVMNVEKAFGISIPDTEAEKIATVGELADWISENITFAKDRKCATQLLFYKLRQYFISSFNIPRKDIKPGSYLENIIPPVNRAAHWKTMSKLLDFELPPLKKDDLGPDHNIVSILTRSSGSLLKGRTIRDLIEWIEELNRIKLEASKGICNKHDVEQIIIAITSEATGIPAEKIKLKHSFTNDLGID